MKHVVAHLALLSFGAAVGIGYADGASARSVLSEQYANFEVSRCIVQIDAKGAERAVEGFLRRPHGYDVQRLRERWVNACQTNVWPVRFRAELMAGAMAEALLARGKNAAEPIKSYAGYADTADREVNRVRGFFACVVKSAPRESTSLLSAPLVSAQETAALNALASRMKSVDCGDMHLEDMSAGDGPFHIRSGIALGTLVTEGNGIAVAAN